MREISCEPVITPTIATLLRKKRGRERGWHLPGIPFSVSKRARQACCGGPTLLQLIALQLLGGQANGAVTLQPTVCESCGYSQRHLRHDQERLQQAGLIRCTTAPGKRREIELLDEEYLEWLGDRKT